MFKLYSNNVLIVSYPKLQSIINKIKKDKITSYIVYDRNNKLVDVNV